jgi:hypothetical protein
MYKQQPKRRATDINDSVFTLRRRSKFSLLVAALCVLFPLLFIGGQIKELLAPSTDIYRDTAFSNLTRQNLRWDVFYGKSPLCGTIECHLTAEYPADRFTKQMVLPAREFPLNGFKPGNMIYLRTTLTIPPEIRDADSPVALHSLYVWAKKYEFFVNGVQVDEGSAETLNLTIPRRLVQPDGVVHLAMKIDPGNLPYQGLANRKDLLIGDRATLKATAFKPQELKTTYYLWFLLPRLTFCFIFAFLYVFLAQNRELFSFILYILVSSVSIHLESGYAEWVESLGVNRGILAAAFQSFTEFFLILFIHDFFRMKIPGFFRAFRVTMLAQALAIGAAWWLLPAKVTVNLIFAFTIMGRTMAVFYGLYASWTTIEFLTRTRKSPARIVTAKILFALFILALGPMFLENRRLLADILNLNSSGFPWTYTFDLILFAVLASITAFDYGNTANAKLRIERDLKVMEDRLELGRSVQNMLLPAEKSGSRAELEYQFFFETAQTMAGDWYYVWNTSDGATRLFVGDVTGKGPQAALAVAAIISDLTRHRDAGDTVEETIDSLNRHLFKLFGGRVMSTMSVTVIAGGVERGAVTLYNCGTPGWITTSGRASSPGKARYLPLASQQIGTQDSVRVNQMKVRLNAGEFVATFTDGCIDGSRATKKCLDMLGTEPPADAGFIYRVMVDAGKETVQSDDRTALVVTFHDTHDASGDRDLSGHAGHQASA